MLRRSKKVILVAGIVFATIVVCWVIVYNYKSRKSSNNTKGSESKKTSHEPKPAPPQPKLPSKPPSSFPINNVPNKRKHDLGGK